MEIKYVVIPHDGHKIVCGQGPYNCAVIASVDPFVLISVDGSMRWDKEDPYNFISLCPVSEEVWEVVNNRLIGDACRLAEMTS